MVVDALRVVHDALGPVGGQQVGLFERIEEWIVAPVGIVEAPVPGVGGFDGLDRLAGHAPDRGGPEVHVALGEAVLRFDRPLRIGQPIFGDLVKRLEDIDEFLRTGFAELPLFTGLEIGC